MSFCANAYCDFFRTYFRMHRYFVLGFSCALFLTFFIVLWGNKWVRLFACFDFAFCIVWAHPHCLVCRWVFCLLVCFLVLYVHFRACLIFSSDFVLCLMIVCRQIAHIYVFACCRIFGDATSSCVAVFAVGCSFFLRPRLLHCDIYACCNLFCSIYCNFSVFFFAKLVRLFFLQFLALGYTICSCSFHCFMYIICQLCVK